MNPLLTCMQYYLRDKSYLKINNRFLEIGIWTPTIIISFMNLFLMNLNTHNKSPGALDNASGMALVFELGSYFQKPPLKK